LLNSNITQKFFVDGPAGKLETVLAEPNSERRHGIAIIAHPHPLYGGTMDNKVVHTLFKALFELGFVTVKFNYRGVGKSEGSYGDGLGETECHCSSRGNS
jgi:alpha/beta superfamily hydrolase